MKRLIAPFLLACCTGLAIAQNIDQVPALAGAAVDKTNDKILIRDASVDAADGALRQMPIGELVNIPGMFASLATGLTGTAPGLTAGNVTTNANLTGIVTSTGNATAIANGAINTAKLAQSSANTNNLLAWNGSTWAAQAYPLVSSISAASLGNSLRMTGSGWDYLSGTTFENTYISYADPTSTRNLIIPNASGTFAVTSNADGSISSITGNAATVTTNANLTGPVTSTGNVTAIANGALSIAKTTGLQAELDAKVDDIQLSTTGGSWKIPQFNANADWQTGNFSNDNVIMNPGGNIYIPNKRGIRMMAPDGVTVMRQMYGWWDHDGQGGECIDDILWRSALIQKGPHQFGGNDSNRTAQCLYLVSGSATEADPLRESKAILFNTLGYQIASGTTAAAAMLKDNIYKIASVGTTNFVALGAASNTVGVTFQHTANTGTGTGTGTGYLCTQNGNLTGMQAYPLNVLGTDSVVRVIVDGTLDGFNGVTPGSLTNGKLTGTIAGEFSKDGLFSPGTNPAYIALTSASTVTWSVSKYTGTQHHRLTLAHNATLSSPTGLQAGMSGIFFVKQDGTGSRTLTLPSGSKTPNGGLGAVTLSTSPDSEDKLTWDYDGTSFYWELAPNFSASPDADAVAFFTAAGVTDPSRKSAYNAFVVGCKSDGTWTALPAMWPFEGLTGASQSKDLKGAYNITWSGTPTHDASGVTGNPGASAYGNTGLAPSAFGSSSSQFLYVYNKTTTPTSGGYLMSAQTGGVGYSFIYHYNTGTAYLRYGANELNTASTFFAPSPNFLGHIYLNMTDATNTVAWHNSTSTSYANTPVGRATTPLFLLAQNFNGSASNYSNANLGFAAAGPSMTSGQITAFKARVAALMTALGR